MIEIIKKVKEAKQSFLNMLGIKTEEKNQALKLMAKAIRIKKEKIIEENKKDIKFARENKYSSAMIDRLTLTEERIEGIAQSVEDTIKIQDPVGEIIKTINRPNGLKIEKKRVSIGVIGIIYESRPNVTSDCIALCLKSGNAVILKGGKEAYHSNKVLFEIMRESLEETKIEKGMIQQIESTDRESVKTLLQQDKWVDMIVPRGGKQLIEFVVKESRIPVIKHYNGICHIYVSKRADKQKAEEIALNAKVQRPGVCNAMETLIIDKDIVKSFLPRMIERYKKSNVEIRGDEKVREIFSDIKQAKEEDWQEEYLELILSIKVVEGVREAIEHINKYGSKHTDAIISEDEKEIEEFIIGVDSSSVMVNASTRFSDGYEYGFGAEIGISTDKLHARGPMGLEELTTYKYIVYGDGHIRK